VGNARTALFNWLFARHHGGVFALRIEDTDVERSKEEYEKQLLDDLRWFGLDWDEGPEKGGPFGPYRQSERREIYAEYAEKLMTQGHAYYCFCSAEQLEAERQEALKSGRQPRYSGRCRKLASEEAARRRAASEPAAVRLKITDSSFSWNDLVHGPTTFSSEVIGDPILMRSDGNPAYNYAVVVDDHLMEITHVIRGDDHISNTPRQLAVYRALGWQPPEFAHLSTILGSDRTRLSKRHGATSLANFREEGILPEALRNYLLLLGWSAADGKTEMLNTQEMIAQFSLDRINKSPAVFDQRKLEWLNLQHLLKAPQGELLDIFRPQVRKRLNESNYLSEDEAASEEGRKWLDKITLTLFTSKDPFPHLVRLAKLVFEYSGENAVRGDETHHVVQDAGAREVLSKFIPMALAQRDFDYNRFREIAKTVQKETGKKGKDLFHPIRVALTGETSGPELEKLIPIFEEGSKLPLAHHVKSCAERLREFALAAKV
jgi:nondiscriminating glutamyl-tRNA synthetase